MNDAFIVETSQGNRDYMEDTWYYKKKNEIVVAFVCDGHGGDKISKMTANKLGELLFYSISQCSFQSNYQMGVKIRNTIVKYAEELRNIQSGSTLTGIVSTKKAVYVYNIGDSRTCIKLKPHSIVYFLNPIFNFKGDFDYMTNVIYSETDFFATIDHDTDNEKEVHRVLATGGFIYNERVNDILAVTRALGDTDIGPGVSAVPDIFWFNKEALNGPVVMFSDGIYEPGKIDKKLSKIFSNEYIYNLAVTQGPKKVMDHAKEYKTMDNLTVLIVNL